MVRIVDIFILLYSPSSHFSPESLSRHIHFPVFLSQIWSVVFPMRQLQAVENYKKLQYVKLQLENAPCLHSSMFYEIIFKNDSKYLNVENTSVQLQRPSSVWDCGVCNSFT